LPWAKGFPQLDKQRQAAGYKIWSLRSLGQYLPFARSTWANATAIIASSSHTYSEFSKHREKLFFLPTEIAVRPGQLAEPTERSRFTRDDELELIFVGRLIPLKACDIALRAAAPLLRAGVARFTVVGDGPERQRLHDLVSSLEIEKQVSFLGWLPQEEVLKKLQNSDVMVFPSLREIGGGVVFEALSQGTVPVVADFGGPGDLVNPTIGYKVPMSNQDEMVVEIEGVLRKLAKDRSHLEAMRQRGMAYVREQLTYDRRARVLTDILLWSTGRGTKPELHPPARLVPAG
jgi:glycosyltransferase involved in cell wall biosynthesis